MIDVIRDHLGPEDDPHLWALALEQVLATLDVEPGVVVEVGRCSHWLRPHQSSWTPHGSEGEWFAAPMGYGGGRGIFLPEFDWSVCLRWDGLQWQVSPGRSVRRAVRVTIPGRTTRHPQAVVHSLWTAGKENVQRIYGFRLRAGRWTCTAKQGFRKLARRRVTTHR
jgi:hypothetical protein